ncbi:MAG: UDP-N-acetylmuramoyl-L-alanine--D-glutamate ligase [Firmicutes bacterium]|nr:UDP-N-acetylmuramoyl-L-alanine--D-glutamate ligase [Candidatus Fermentithermobacillaceae bacterium]HOA70805.1 UDP-N-acetylmuramoyl-L-alanine--D-glutamate ligase [Bacillota bacterium]
MPETYKGVQVAVVGMGKSNQALCRYLLGEGAQITCFDRKTKEQLGEVYEEFSQRGVTWRLGPDYLDTLPEYEHIFLTPGMKKHQPQVIEARKRGAKISTEIDLFLKRCKAPVAGITGSAGKTTTSMLVGRMLERSMPGTPVYVGGNIGPVLIEKVDEIPEHALVVLELSSFQLHLCSRSPQYALLLNIRPNHLDIHKDLDEYVEAKKNIFRFQSQHHWCILNYDDTVTRSAAAECPGHVGFFSIYGRPEGAPEHTGHKGQNGYTGCTGHTWRSRVPAAWLDGDDLLYDPGDGSRLLAVASKRDLSIPGNHNISNALGAILISMQMGANPEGIRKAIREFRGIEHRIEFVREVGGVKFYNDSIATSPDRTVALIDSLEGSLVLILGGSDKGLSFDQLARRIVARGCKSVLIGQCAPKIRRSIETAWAEAGLAGTPEIAEAGSLEDAVSIALSMANPGDSVALSPACASYDMFPNFAERGRQFKQIVKAL